VTKPNAAYEGKDLVRVIRMGEECLIERWSMQLGDVFYHEGRAYKVIDIGGNPDGTADVQAEAVETITDRGIINCAI